MPYQQVTLSQMQQLLKDKWESVPFWGDAEATTAINEALRWWNLFTGMWKRKELLATVANQVFYNLSSTLVYNLRMEFQGQLMDLSSIGDLDNGRPQWQGETTASGGVVPTVPRLFAPVGISRIAIWPAHAAGGGSMALDGVRQTPTLSDGGDFIDVGQPELHAILGEALHIAAFKEAGPRFAATQHFHSEFLIAASALNGRLKASTLFRKAMGLDQNRKQRPMEVERGA